MVLCITTGEYSHTQEQPTANLACRGYLCIYLRLLVVLITYVRYNRRYSSITLCLYSIVVICLDIYVRCITVILLVYGVNLQFTKYDIFVLGMLTLFSSMYDMSTAYIYIEHAPCQHTCPPAQAAASLGLQS